jgi:hypothetical protein
MSGVEFSWDNPNLLLSQVESLLRKQGARIKSVPERAVRRGTFELLALVQKNTPRRTSTLVRSVQAIVRKISDDLVEGRVGTWMQYARFVEEGTGIYGPLGKPILITATKRKGLFWGAYDANGRPIVRKRVVVKGMKPRSPFQKAVAQFLPRYLEIIQQELAREAA